MCSSGFIHIELPDGVRVSVGAGTNAVGVAATPAPLPTRVFLACGVTDLRKGFDDLAVLVQQVPAQNPHSTRSRSASG